MRGLAKLLAGLALAAAAILAYLALGSGLNAQISVNTVPATQLIDVYERAVGSREGAEECYIVSISASVKNKGMLSAEWVELHFSPLEGDVVVFGEGAGPADIAAFGERQFNVSVITRNTAGRSAWLSYYLVGRERIAE